MNLGIREHDSGPGGVFDCEFGFAAFACDAADCTGEMVSLKGFYAEIRLVGILGKMVRLTYSLISNVSIYKSSSRSRAIASSTSKPRVNALTNSVRQFLNSE